ncbi:MAG: hypothetical protein QM831_42035 [Kofleriaceae bacterium]
MKRLLLATMVLVVGCHKADDAAGGGDDGTGGMGGMTGMDAAPTPEMITDVNADVTADTEWSGLVKVHKTVTVAAGVTLTVDPGTSIQFDRTAGMNVLGTMNVGGTKAMPVSIGAAPGNANFGDWGIPSGTVSMTYVVMKGAGFAISGTGALTVRDSTFSHHVHDLLVIGGGTVDMQYSWIGEPEGTADTTHCDIHIQGGTPKVTVSHTNLSTSSYGIMLYTGIDVDLTYDNWFSNSLDIDKSAGTTGDVSFGYFAKGAPSLSDLTASNMSSAMVSDAGPR